uniref:Putative 26s proteasome regulatory complex subunit psmd10 n=1 Tax=Nyssomyia neivai TaxID=330878 RepID=A0A1L8DSM1_9DIPT
MTDHWHDAGDEGVCKCKPSAAAQTLDEMDFERGIWTAALYGDMKRLEIAIQRGATNDCDNSGYTALHYAARAGHMEACTRLLAAGADVNCTTNGGVTPLHRAAMMGRVAIVEFLCQHGAHTATCDSDGQNALHRAAHGGHKDVIEYLVARDASLRDVCDKRGRFPCDLAPNDDLRNLLAPQKSLR